MKRRTQKKTRNWHAVNAALRNSAGAFIDKKRKYHQALEVAEMLMQINGLDKDPALTLLEEEEYDD